MFSSAASQTLPHQNGFGSRCFSTSEVVDVAASVPAKTASKRADHSKSCIPTSATAETTAGATGARAPPARAPSARRIITIAPNSAEQRGWVVAAVADASTGLPAAAAVSASDVPRTGARTAVPASDAPTAPASASRPRASVNHITGIPLPPPKKPLALARFRDFALRAPRALPIFKASSTNGGRDVAKVAAKGAAKDAESPVVAKRSVAAPTVANPTMRKSSAPVVPRRLSPSAARCAAVADGVVRRLPSAERMRPRTPDASAEGVDESRPERKRPASRSGSQTLMTWQGIPSGASQQARAAPAGVVLARRSPQRAAKGAVAAGEKEPGSPRSTTASSYNSPTNRTPSGSFLAFAFGRSGSASFSPEDFPPANLHRKKSATSSSSIYVASSSIVALSSRFGSETTKTPEGKETGVARATGPKSAAGASTTCSTAPKVAPKTPPSPASISGAGTSLAPVTPKTAKKAPAPASPNSPSTPVATPGTPIAAPSTPAAIRTPGTPATPASPATPAAPSTPRVASAAGRHAKATATPAPSLVARLLSSFMAVGTPKASSGSSSAKVARPTAQGSSSPARGPVAPIKLDAADRKALGALPLEPPAASNSREYLARVPLPIRSPVRPPGAQSSEPALHRGLSLEKDEDARPVVALPKDSDVIERIAIGEGFQDSDAVETPRMVGRGAAAPDEADIAFTFSSAAHSSPRSRTSSVHDAPHKDEKYVELQALSDAVSSAETRMPVLNEEAPNAAPEGGCGGQTAPAATAATAATAVAPEAMQSLASVSSDATLSLQAPNAHDAAQVTNAQLYSSLDEPQQHLAAVGSPCPLSDEGSFASACPSIYACRPPPALPIDPVERMVAARKWYSRLHASERRELAHTEPASRQFATRSARRAEQRRRWEADRDRRMRASDARSRQTSPGYEMSEAERNDKVQALVRRIDEVLENSPCQRRMEQARRRSPFTPDATMYDNDAVDECLSRRRRAAGSLPPLVPSRRASDSPAPAAARSGRMNAVPSGRARSTTLSFEELQREHAAFAASAASRRLTSPALSVA